MKCPKCKKEITYVNVISTCWQKADIDKKGKITEYRTVEDIEDTQFIECPECQAKITKYIKQ